MKYVGELYYTPLLQVAHCRSTTDSKTQLRHPEKDEEPTFLFSSFSFILTDSGNHRFSIIMENW